MIKKEFKKHRYSPSIHIDPNQFPIVVTNIQSNIAKKSVYIYKKNDIKNYVKKYR
jgi:LEA14-like dessication related protein